VTPTYPRRRFPFRYQNLPPPELPKRLGLSNPTPAWLALDLSRDAALQQLEDKPAGTFLIRRSQHSYAAFSCVVDGERGTLLHLHVVHGPRGFQLQDHDAWFGSIEEMVAFFADPGRSSRYLKVPPLLL